MSGYPIAYGVDHLRELVNTNDSCRDITISESERLVEVAQQRADSNSALDDGEKHCLVTTDWHGFCLDNFGQDTSDSTNEFAIGTFDHGRTMGRDAILFNDTIVVQHGWLNTGDGRKTKVKRYTDDFDGASMGEFWLPKSVEEYVCIIELSGEMIHGSVDVSEAM